MAVTRASRIHHLMVCAGIPWFNLRLSPGCKAPSRVRGTMSQQMNWLFALVLLPGVFWALTCALVWVEGTRIPVLDTVAFVSTNLLVPALVGVVAYLGWRYSRGKLEPCPGAGWLALAGIHLMVTVWLLFISGFALSVDTLKAPLYALQAYFYLCNPLALILSVIAIAIAAKLHREKMPPGAYFGDMLRKAAPGLFRE